MARRQYRPRSWEVAERSVRAARSDPPSPAPRDSEREIFEQACFTVELPAAAGRATSSRSAAAARRARRRSGPPTGVGGPLLAGGLRCCALRVSGVLAGVDDREGLAHEDLELRAGARPDVGLVR